MKPFIGLLCVFALASPLLVIATPLLAQPTRPAITGIAFARFYTTDPAGAQKFYGDTLGFERKQVDGMWLYPVNNAQWIEVLTTPPPQPNVRLDAVAFTTRDAAGLQRYLQAHGIKPDILLANGQFAVRDPEGNLARLRPERLREACRLRGHPARCNQHTHHPRRLHGP